MESCRPPPPHPPNRKASGVRLCQALGRPLSRDVHGDSRRPLLTSVHPRVLEFADSTAGKNERDPPCFLRAGSATASPAQGRSQASLQAAPGDVKTLRLPATVETRSWTARKAVKTTPPGSYCLRGRGPRGGVGSVLTLTTEEQGGLRGRRVTQRRHHGQQVLATPSRQGSR